MSTPCLPQELLDVVFEYAMGSPDDWVEFVWVRCLIRAMCRQWKASVDNKPTLWRHVRLARYTDSSFMQVYLDRTESNPFDLVIDLRDYIIVQTRSGSMWRRPVLTDIPEFVSKVAELLADHMHRVASLVVEAPTYAACRAMIHALRCHAAPAMQKAHLCVVESDRSRASFAPLEPPGWTQLSELSLVGLPLFPLGLSIYRSLTRLDIAGTYNHQLPVRSLTDALGECSRLVSLSLEEVQFTDGHGSAVSLPVLARLRLCYSKNICVCVLSNILTPALQTILIEGYGRPSFDILVDHCSHILQAVPEVCLNFDKATGSFPAFCRALSSVSRVDISRSSPRIWDEVRELLKSGQSNWTKLAYLRIGDPLEQQDFRDLFAPKVPSYTVNKLLVVAPVREIVINIPADDSPHDFIEWRLKDGVLVPRLFKEIIRRGSTWFE